MATCGTIFGTSNSQYIKVNGGDFIAIEGSNTIERFITSDLRIPYKQLVKSKVILKAGQVNYLLNHLGLGDNVTFLIIKATYDPKSVNEEDNYLSWSYYDDMTRMNYMDQLLVLTGNSTHRIPQLYITNPNSKYAVSLDIMVANIDDSYNYFNNTLDQTGTTFVNLEYTDVKTHVVGESIVVNDRNSNPLIYLILDNINSIEIMGNILTINDSSRDLIFLHFSTQYDANQAHSLLNYVIENPSININTLNPVNDAVAPIVYFYSNVGNTSSNSYISFNGATSGVPYSTGDGVTFSTSISLSQNGNFISKSDLIDLLINNTIDNRDGTMSIFDSNISLGIGLTISGTSSGGTMSSITSTGTYSVVFNLSDIAKNYVDGIITLSIVN